MHTEANQEDGGDVEEDDLHNVSFKIALYCSGATSLRETRKRTPVGCRLRLGGVVAVGEVGDGGADDDSEDHGWSVLTNEYTLSTPS